MKIFGNENTDWCLELYVAGLTQKTAGLVCIDIHSRPLNLGLSAHLLVRTSFWQVGYLEDWYDGEFYSLGLGPLALFCWTFDRRARRKDV